MFLKYFNDLSCKINSAVIFLLCLVVSGQAIAVLPEGWRLFVRVDNRLKINPLIDVNRPPATHLSIEGGTSANWSDSGYMSVFEVTNAPNVIDLIAAGEKQTGGVVYHFIAVPRDSYTNVTLTGGVRKVNEGDGSEIVRTDHGNVWEQVADREFRIYSTFGVELALGPGEYREYFEHLFSGDFPDGTLFSNQVALREWIRNNRGLCSVTPANILNGMREIIGPL